MDSEEVVNDDRRPLVGGECVTTKPPWPFQYLMTGRIKIFSYWKRKKKEKIPIYKRIQEKTPHKMSSQEKTPQEKTPQKSPVEKTPHPVLGLVEKTPRVIFRLVEKTPQLYKKPSLWKFGIFIRLHIENHV